MNLKLYQKIYIVTNEQCIKADRLNALSCCPPSIVRYPHPSDARRLQYNLRAKYTIIVVIFHFRPRALSAEHRPNVRFFVISFPVR